MPEAGAVLDVEEVHTYYGESHVLQGISLRVEASEVLGILGRNGMSLPLAARGPVSGRMSPTLIGPFWAQPAPEAMTSPAAVRVSVTM